MLEKHSNSLYTQIEGHMIRIEIIFYEVDEILIFVWFIMVQSLGNLSSMANISKI